MAKGKIGLVALVLLAVLGPLLAAAPPSAAGEAADRLTLDEAVAIALREHPTLKTSRDKMDAARYQIGVSRSAYFPQTRFDWNYFYGNAFLRSARGASAITGPSTVSSPLSITQEGTNFWVYRFSLNQLVYDFGKTSGTVDQSKANFQSSKEDYAGNRQQVVLDAKSAYYGLLAARRAQKVAEENVRQNQELYKQAQGFYNVGLKAKIDVTKAEANLANAEANLIKAKNAVDLARVSLTTALGLKVLPAKELEDVLEATPPPRPLEELRSFALERRPEIVRNRHQQDAGQAAVRVARSGYFPTLSGTAAYGWQGPDYPVPGDWWLGAAVSFPLFEGGLTRYSVAVARSNLSATASDLEVLRQNVTKEVEQSYLDVKSGWEFIKATQKALDAARENLRLAWGRYQAGVGTIIEVTDAQVQFAQADLHHVQALYDYQINLARLDKATGKPY
jgi:TolC family type I secretion outer membrane protein